jgi:hypothetical protein
MAASIATCLRAARDPQSCVCMSSPSASVQNLVCISQLCGLHVKPWRYMKVPIPSHSCPSYTSYTFLFQYQFGQTRMALCFFQNLKIYQYTSCHWKSLISNQRRTTPWCKLIIVQHQACDVAWNDNGVFWWRKKLGSDPFMLRISLGFGVYRPG